MPCCSNVEAYRARWFALWPFQLICGKCTKVSFWGTHLIRLHPTSGCDMLHTNGAQYGFAFRCSSRYMYGSIWFGMLWTTSGGGPPWHDSTTGLVRVLFKRALGHTLMYMVHVIDWSEYHNSIPCLFPSFLKPKYSFGKWWKWKISLIGIVHKSCMSSQSPVNLFVRNHQFS